MFNYLFTITFQSHYTISDKLKLIEHFKNIFLNHQIYGELEYSIEYHKKKNKSNNLFAPHLHGILTMPKQLPKYKFLTITDYIKRRYGRSQFFLQQDEEEVLGYREYMFKDVQQNNDMYAISHYFQQTLERVHTCSEEEHDIDILIP